MKKNFYTTGEISALLDISRATVSRKFDSGLFQGKKNPITGERLISRDSLFAFMKKYNLPINSIVDYDSKKTLLLVSANKNLQSLINKTFLSDEQFDIDIVTSGYEALIKCSQQNPDIFLIDKELPDFDCKKAVETIKSNENLGNIKILCILKTDKSCNDKSCAIDDFIIQNDNAIHIVNKISSLFVIPENVNPDNAPFQHQRMWPRIKINMPGNVELFVSDLPDLNNGDTIVENISLGGAYLSNINMHKNKIPFGTSKMLLTVDHPPFENLKEECQIVRLHGNGSMSAGVKFLNLNNNNKNKILKLMSAV